MNLSTDGAEELGRGNGKGASSVETPLLELEMSATERRGKPTNWLRGALDAIMGSAGRRRYDKRRIGVLLALLALVQFGAQTGSTLIHEMFLAYRDMAEKNHQAELEQRKLEHTESIKVQRETADAIKELAVEIRRALDERKKKP